MTDEEITYAPIIFSANKTKFTAEKEEIVYDEVKVKYDNPPEPNGGLLRDKTEGVKARLSQLFHCGCWICCGFLLLAVIGLSVYIALFSPRGTDKLSHLKTNQTKLLENSQNHSPLQNALLSDYENLRKVHRNLTALWSNLMDSFTDLQTQIRIVSAENLQLMTQNKELKQQKDNMEAEWNKLNGSRAQWSIDAYCPKEKNGRNCKACQKKWTHLQTKCYEINEKQKVSWRQAQQDCEWKNSQLLLLNKVPKIPKKISSANEFWIGLSVENEKWRWINGSSLTDLSKPLEDGHCAAVSAKDKDWKSVNCNNNNYWICEKEPLSL